MGQVIEAEVDGKPMTLFKYSLSIIDRSNEESFTSASVSTSTSATPSRLAGFAQDYPDREGRGEH
jgi:hypothetical protein